MCRAGQGDEIKGAVTAGVDSTKMNEYLHMSKEVLVELVRNSVAVYNSDNQP